MERSSGDCGQGNVEFEDLRLVVGEKKAREICREHEGKTLPTPPPDMRVERNKRIKKLYFKDGLTQETIAKRVGLSRVWVNRIINREH